MIFPTLLIVVWTVASTLFMAWVLDVFTKLDIATALFAGATGGVAEMSVLAIAYDTDVSVVALLQFLRLALIILFIPALVLRIEGKLRKETVATLEVFPQKK